MGLCLLTLARPLVRSPETASGPARAAVIVRVKHREPGGPRDAGTTVRFGYPPRVALESRGLEQVSAFTNAQLWL